MSIIESRKVKVIILLLLSISMVVIILFFYIFYKDLADKKNNMEKNNMESQNIQGGASEYSDEEALLINMGSKNNLPKTIFSDEDLELINNMTPKDKSMQEDDDLEIEKLLESMSPKY